MIPTIPYIQQKFGEFNRLIFNGKLPELPIELSRAKSFLGVVVYKKKRGLFGKVKNYDFRLRISTRLDLPEQEVEDTIIHEMIHYYIAYNNIRDTSTHGTIFRQMMNDINNHFGRHLTISHRSTKEQKEQLVDKKSRPHVIAVVYFHNGTAGIKVLPRIRERILYYRRSVMRSTEIQKVDLYFSTNPFFNRFPTSAALKVHPLDIHVITENTKDAQPLELS